MTVELYTISYRVTGNVLGFCTLEKQDLPDRAAWDAFRTLLVGKVLPIGLSNDKVGVPAADLGVDRITGASIDALAANPYVYQVVFTPPVTADNGPGDGKDKTLLGPTAGQQVNDMMIDRATATVTVKLSFEPPVTVSPRLVFDQETLRGTADRAAKQVTFKVPPSISLHVGDPHDLVFLMETTPVTYRSVLVA